LASQSSTTHHPAVPAGTAADDTARLTWTARASSVSSRPTTTVLQGIVRCEAGPPLSARSSKGPGPSTALGESALLVPASRAVPRWPSFLVTITSSGCRQGNAIACHGTPHVDRASQTGRWSHGPESAARSRPAAGHRRRKREAGGDHGGFCTKPAPISPPCQLPGSADAPPPPRAPESTQCECIVCPVSAEKLHHEDCPGGTGATPAHCRCGKPVCERP